MNAPDFTTTQLRRVVRLAYDVTRPEGLVLRWRQMKRTKLIETLENITEDGRVKENKLAPEVAFHCLDGIERITPQELQRFAPVEVTDEMVAQWERDLAAAGLQSFACDLSSADKTEREAAVKRLRWLLEEADGFPKRIVELWSNMPAVLAAMKVLEGNERS